MTSMSPPGPFDLLTQVAGDPVMRDIFSERANVEAWLRSEVALATAQAELGIIPRSARDAIAHVAHVDRIDLVRLWEETRVVGYPILPLIRQLDELLPAQERGTVHLGATTQDIMDTGLVLQLVAASDHLIALLDQVGDALEQRARRARDHRDGGANARNACGAHDLRGQARELPLRRHPAPRARGRDPRRGGDHLAARRRRHLGSIRSGVTAPAHDGRCRAGVACRGSPLACVPRPSG